MNEKIIVPALGESIKEATIAKWLKKKGDEIAIDEPVVELETDKVNLEVPSPISGVLSELNFKNGDTVQVGAVLGTISEENQEIKTNKKYRETKSEEKKNISNVVNIELEKNTEPKIFDELKTEQKPLILQNEEPLILKNELKEEKIMDMKSVLSPAVRKIVSEKKN